MEWISFKDAKPSGEKYVVLFAPITDAEDISIPITASNPKYAAVNAEKNGFTHWIELPELPEARSNVKRVIEKSLAELIRWRLAHE